jgi:hypothetical protein
LPKRAHCSDPTRYQSFFVFFKYELSCKLEKPPLYCSKNSQILYSARLEDKEQLSFWNQVQIPNRI